MMLSPLSGFPTTTSSVSLACLLVPSLLAGEKLHVLDLDNDGLITPGELQDALRFLRSNLDEEDLMALLER